MLHFWHSRDHRSCMLTAGLSQTCLTFAPSSRKVIESFSMQFKCEQLIESRLNLLSRKTTCFENFFNFYFFTIANKIRY